MHIVVLPFPMQGHLNPLLMLAKILAFHGFTFTFVVTEELAAKMEEQENDPETPELFRHSIRHSIISCPGAASMPSSRTRFNFLDSLQMLDKLRPEFENLIRNLVSSPSGVTCIIIDCFVLWGQQVASDYNIPAFLFYTTNAHALCVALQAPNLIARGLTVSEERVDCLPGIPNLQAGDIPLSIRAFPSFAVGLAEGVLKAGKVILNTVLELEREPLEFIRSKVSFYSIGPMGLMLPSEKAVKGHRVSFWVEERECLDWLNAMPDSSVLYVAFGSLASLDYAQVKVIAEGLEASEQAFLWVIRSDDLPSKILPEGFIQRTKNRGLIISWAPQPEVLSHRAVGGFFTHCGWNSVTENLSLRALPMICWPQLAEQKLNRRFLVDKFQVALELEEEKGLVKKEELEKAIREIMQGDAGRELRERALKCKDIILSAVQEGGFSQRHLRDLVEDIKKLGSTGNDS